VKGPAGYSGTPLFRKLGIKQDSRVSLIRAPEGFERALVGLPPGVELRRRATRGSQVVVAFARSRAELRRQLPVGARALAPTGARLWLAWPKRASGVPTDLREADVRGLGLESGFVDYKIAALDECWSGLCFARRESR
jgi:hypothetical protein